MQKSLAALLLMLVVCSAPSMASSCFAQAGRGREFGGGWIRKSISFHGCHFKENQGLAVAGEEVCTGEQWQFSAGLALPLAAVLLLRLPSLSTSACEALNLTPFLGGSSLGSADVSTEQNKNTCSLLGMGEGKELTAKSPVLLNCSTKESLCFQLSARVPPDVTEGDCPICTPCHPAGALGLSSSLQEARRCHSQDKGSPLPGSQQLTNLSCAVLLQPWLRKQPNKTPQRLPG